MLFLVILGILRPQKTQENQIPCGGGWLGDFGLKTSWEFGSPCIYPWEGIETVLKKENFMNFN